MKLIDLSLEIYDGLRSYTSHPPIAIAEESTFENSRHRYVAPCEGFESRMLKMSDHSGTHIDAPLHFMSNGESTSEMDLSQAYGKALLLDVSDYKDPFQAVTREMLEEAEKRQGITVQPNDIVLTRTRKLAWGEGSFYEEHAFAPCAGDWLLEKQVKCVGLDLANIDIHDNMMREVHLKLLSVPVYIVENLVNLHQLPLNEHFTFMALPLKLKNATASPVRAVAFIE
ncbi:cyclase family protein [Psychrobacillus psychrodurans]|uniref:Cyclase family protein n=1 Tax=Psychrobacillus psychrodurans TaxID=126157 RepID=A0A9X3RBI4_9BACI|nr:cyclase family protein [Psychrobacillus psychrodurans]MCZ8534227.1 cyclase family protein [Psychrobacillus psychrodurans]MCZ8541370.1 cyclase family protein [Psychrobacillus psychrodurans]SFM97232.1 Kynurenine formamidase [Psychrobacillus psychrodurans]